MYQNQFQNEEILHNLRPQEFYNISPKLQEECLDSIFEGLNNLKFQEEELPYSYFFE